MNIICEMLVQDFFKLSVGHVALVGKVFPDISSFIPKCKADLFIAGEKVRTLNILGEDRFTSQDNIKRESRSVRTEDDIYNELSMNAEKIIKLIMY